MKKIYSLTLALMAVGSFAAMAESLPEPVLVDPAPGSTVITTEILSSFTVDWGEEIELVKPISTTASNSDWYGFSLKDAADAYGVDLTADYYTQINLSSDSFTTLIMGLYSSGESSTGGADETATGIICLGMGFNPNDGVPNVLDDISGQITITIPAGTVQKKGDSSIQNEEVSYSFSVMAVSVASGDFTPTPSTMLDDEEDDSYTQSALKEVKLTWKNVKSLTFSGSKNSPYVIDPNDPIIDGFDNRTYVHYPIPEENIELETNSLVLDLSYLKAGLWEVIVPMGYVIFDGSEVNMEETATYKVDMFSGEATFEVEDDVITVSWANAYNLVLNEEADITFRNMENGLEYNINSALVAKVSDDGNKIIIDPSGLSVYLLPSGTYKVILNGGLVTLTYKGENLVNPVAYYDDFVFTNNNPLESVPDIIKPSASVNDEEEGNLDDDKTVEVLSQISINWNNLPISLNAGYEGEQPKLVLANLNEEEVETVGTRDDAVPSLIKEYGIENGTDLVFTFDTLEDGTYTLIVPSEFILITYDNGQYYNDTVEVSRTQEATSTNPGPGEGEGEEDGEGEGGSTGISSVISNQNATIFTINGLKVDNNKVSKGIFIINGKKIIVK